MILKQKIKQNISNGMAVMDIASRDIALMLLGIFAKDFDYTNDKFLKIKQEIGNILNNKNHTIDKIMGKYIIDGRLNFAEFGTSGKKYMIPISQINIGKQNHKYISIAHMSDNIYDIKLANNDNVICNYENAEFNIKKNQNFNKP